MNLQPFDFSSLSLGEKIMLAQQLWDSVDADNHLAPLTSDQLAEIEKRSAAVDAGELIGIPWEQAQRIFRAT